MLKDGYVAFDTRWRSGHNALELFKNEGLRAGVQAGASVSELVVDKLKAAREERRGDGA